jgi:hypothetical protein
MILRIKSSYFLNSIKRLIFVVAKCGVFFAVRSEFLNVIYRSSDFKAFLPPRQKCLSLLSPNFLFASQAS